ncbi:MAG: PAS domain S-box protein [Alphaproteobacteria bacterium]|nr:PAS domain S-box protein [Alphaproteobacteria bacterium]
MFSLRRKKDEIQGFPFSQSVENDDARIVVDNEGTIVFASAAFMKMAQLTRDTISEHNFSTILKFQNEAQSPNDIEPGAHNVFLYGDQTAQEFHFDWINMPDSRRFLVASYNLNHNDNIEMESPLPQNAHSTHDDIDVFLNLSREMMVVIDENGKILRANARFGNTIGYSAQELDDIAFINLFDEEDKPHVQNAIQSAHQGDTRPQSPEAKRFDIEARIITKQKASIWVEWRQQHLSGLTYFAGRDVTAIKTQQKALQHREKQLLQAESLGRMGHWRWVLGEDSIEWSDEIYRIFGVDPENFDATLDNMNQMVHSDDIDRLNQALHRAVIEENDYDVEFSILRPDGEERVIRSEGRCSRDDEGEVIALFGIMQDMTERMLYERELKTAKDAAERAYSAKTQFLANMSHELRTPLNAIIGFSEMMERQLLGPLGNEKYVDYIGGIRESGEHLLDLISDILDMSKIEAGKYDLMLEELNISKVIHVALHMMEGRALESGIKIKNNLNADEELKIVADRRGILQILLNILSNAVKFSNDNGQIDVQCNAHENGIILKISDNGIGIPANKLATITNPFEQVSSSYARDHEGSGLGLAITKELIELHQGTLKIESTIEVGTTVTIGLPYQQPIQDTENHT